MAGAGAGRAGDPLLGLVRVGGGAGGAEGEGPETELKMVVGIERNSGRVEEVVRVESKSRKRRRGGCGLGSCIFGPHVRSSVGLWKPRF